MSSSRPSLVVTLRQPYVAPSSRRVSLSNDNYRLYEHPQFPGDVVAARHDFYTRYFIEVRPQFLIIDQRPEPTTSRRKEIRLVFEASGRRYAFMSGLVHHQNDRQTAEVAAGEAVAHVAGENQVYGQQRFTFRVFEAADRIRFYKGDMRDKFYDLEEEFHPLHDFQAIHEYLYQAAVRDQRIP